MNPGGGFAFIPAIDIIQAVVNLLNFEKDLDRGPRG